jgi:hypothetical protein
MSHKEVDDLLNKAVKALGAPAFKRPLIYRSVCVSACKSDPLLGDIGVQK